MINNTFIGNRAGEDGGAVDLNNLESEAYIANNSFNNMADRTGGAIETWQYPSILEKSLLLTMLPAGMVVVLHPVRAV